MKEHEERISQLAATAREEILFAESGADIRKALNPIFTADYRMYPYRYTLEQRLRLRKEWKGYD